ncbi:MAG: PQQ-dependent sugar dehydrogenase [Planctomycetes bacterium]|nr:PQQ-dependent sugar dehydrogenase [Planctomycetota bacterium]
MPRLVRLTALLAPAVLGLSLAGGCLCADDTPPPINVGANLEAEYVVYNAAQPSALAFAADGRVFYTEKNTGRIRVIVDGSLAEQPFAEVPVNYADDRGLLGIALHPSFASNGRVYVFYTRSDTGLTTADPQAVVDNRVVYFEANGNVAAGGEIFVASLPAASGTTHIGGRLAFAADGTLYVALGDQTAENAAQDNTVHTGKVLRYNADGSIPAGNPSAGSPVFARGVRDMRGLAFDPESAIPFITDRNPAGQEEINRVLSGRNYGWPEVIGPATTAEETQFVADNPDYVEPLFDTGDERPGLVGGSFNPSARYGPNLVSDYFYGEATKRRVQRIKLTSERRNVASRAVFAERFPSTITDVAFTPAGTLYVACEDAILRVVPVR